MNQSLSPGVDSEARVSLSLAVAGDVDNGPAVTALSTTISFNIKKVTIRLDARCISNY